jgi:hypothetical protein
LSKIHSGFPPERTVADRDAAPVFTLAAVLELVAPCFCANFSRLSNLAMACQPEYHFPLTMLVPAQIPRLPRFAAAGWSANLSNIFSAQPQLAAGD